MSITEWLTMLFCWHMAEKSSTELTGISVDSEPCKFKFATLFVVIWSNFLIISCIISLFSVHAFNVFLISASILAVLVRMFSIRLSFLLDKLNISHFNIQFNIKPEKQPRIKVLTIPICSTFVKINKNHWIFQMIYPLICKTKLRLNIIFIWKDTNIEI